MRIISTQMHAIMDYLYGVLLVIAPWIFGFARGGAETIIPVIIGVSVLLMAVMTDYEYSLTKKIPMTTHLTVDVVAGIFLALSPWLFGFSEFVFVPHLLFGLIAVGSGMMTEKTPGRTPQGIRT